MSGHQKGYVVTKITRIINGSMSPSGGHYISIPKERHT